MGLWKVWTAAAAFALLAACTGEQRAIEGTMWTMDFNVVTTKVDDRTFDVNGAGPPGKTHEEVYKRMMATAAQTTLDKGYDKFSATGFIAKTMNTTSTYTGQVFARRPMVEFRMEMFRNSETPPATRRIYDARQVLSAAGS